MLGFAVAAMLQMGDNLFAHALQVPRVLARNHLLRKVEPVGAIRQPQVDCVAALRILVIDRRALKRVAQSLHQNLDFLFHAVSDPCGTSGGTSAPDSLMICLSKLGW